MVPAFLNSINQTDIINMISFGHVNSNINSSNVTVLNTNLLSTGSLYSFPVINYGYDQSYIEANFDTTFSEFVTSSASTQSIQESQSLQIQLNNANVQLNATASLLNTLLSQSVNLGNTTSLLAANENLVIGLRIQLGQGSSSADFESTFPWRPLTSLYTTSSSTTGSTT